MLRIIILSLTQLHIYSDETFIIWTCNTTLNVHYLYRCRVKNKMLGIWNPNWVLRPSKMFLTSYWLVWESAQWGYNHHVFFLIHIQKITSSDMCGFWFMTIFNCLYLLVWIWGSIINFMFLINVQFGRESYWGIGEYIS